VLRSVTEYFVADGETPDHGSVHQLEKSLSSLGPVSWVPRQLTTNQKRLANAVTENQSLRSGEQLYHILSLHLI